MLNAFTRFHVGIWRSPVWVRLWLAALLGANLIAPFLFWETVEAKLTLATMMAAMMIMVGLTAATGFSRLLGAGHFVWFPLVAWLATRLGDHPPESDVGLWLRVLILVNSISLVIDVIDVIRWLRGDRAETVATT